MQLRTNLEKVKAMSTEEQNRIIMEIEESACSSAKEYRGCSQWPLYALQQKLNLWDKDVFRAASALAGGIAGSGEVCGALVGGLMLIGLLYGRDELESIETSSDFDQAMELGARLCDGFQQEFGSLRCRDVQKQIFGRAYDFRDAKEKKEFFSRDDVDKCSDIVIRKVARLSAEVILQP